MINCETYQEAASYLEHPAVSWDRGIPAGNGRQGVMLYGEPPEERILLNEESLWYGKKNCRTQSVGKEKLKFIRRLLEKGQAEEAQKLCRRWFTANPKYTNPFLPGAEILIDVCMDKSDVRDYSRGLDMERGIGWMKFLSGKVSHQRELLASVRFQVVAYRMETSAKGSLSFEVSLNRRPFEEHAWTEKDALYLSGETGAGAPWCTGCMAADTDGTVKIEGGFMVVEDASYAVILLCLQTGYEGKDPVGECRRILAEAAGAGYREIRRAHEKDYGRIWNKMRLDICGDEYTEQLPADQLLRRCNEPAVQAYLTQLLFNYARYLMIRSSYGCALPANLQGIWNGDFTPLWESGYSRNLMPEIR